MQDKKSIESMCQNYGYKDVKKMLEKMLKVALFLTISC